MPNGRIGIGSSTASTSLSVFAVAVTVAEPGALAAKRQSSRRSAPLVERAAGRRVRADGREARGFNRHRRRPRPRACSCAPCVGTTTSSPSVRKRGVITRTIRSFVVVVRAIVDAGPGVFGDRARGQPPGGERIGIRDGDAPACRVASVTRSPTQWIASGNSLRTCACTGLIALEVGERERPPLARGQLQPVASRIAGEVIRARERRADARVFAAIEEADRIGRVVGLDAVDGFVDHGEADLRAHRLPGLIGHRHVEHARIARPRHRLLRRHRHVQRASMRPPRRAAVRRDTAGLRAGRRC